MPTVPLPAGSGPGGTPRPADLYPASPQSQVFLLTLLSFLIFVAAGKDERTKVTDKLNSLRPSAPPASTPTVVGGLTVGNVLGWGGLFLILVTLSDLPPTQKLGQALAWLVFIGTLTSFGQAALDNVGGITTTAAKTTPPPTSKQQAPGGGNKSGGVPQT